MKAEDFPFTKEQLQWLEALESGVYAQTTKKLNDGKGNFCCLGVACDIFQHKVEGSWKQRSSWSSFFIGEKAAKTYLPEKMWKFLKLRGKSGGIIHRPRGPYLHTLAAMNDSGSPFEKIVKHIRKYPERYFTNLD